MTAQEQGGFMELFRIAITGTQAEGLRVALVRFAAFAAVVVTVCLIGTREKEQ